MLRQGHEWKKAEYARAAIPWKRIRTRFGVKGVLMGAIARSLGQDSSTADNGKHFPVSPVQNRHIWYSANIVERADHAH